ncbi:MAG: hypothetical protein ACXVCY_19315 [Pseudobdellovibrionaceae bacterium]
MKMFFITTIDKIMLGKGQMESLTMKKFIVSFAAIYLSTVSLAHAMGGFEEQVEKDTQTFSNKTGFLEVAIDGKTENYAPTPCKLQVRLEQTSARLNLLTSLDNINFNNPEFQFYLFDLNESNKTALRTIQPSNVSIIYSEPTNAYYAVKQDCGSLGHASFPLLNQKIEFELNANFVQAKLNFSCASTKRHQVIYRCNFSSQH